MCALCCSTVSRLVVFSTWCSLVIHYCVQVSVHEERDASDQPVDEIMPFPAVCVKARASMRQPSEFMRSETRGDQHLDRLIPFPADCVKA